MSQRFRKQRRQAKKLAVAEHKAKFAERPKPVSAEKTPPLVNDPCPSLLTDPHRIREDLTLIERGLNQRWPMKPEWRQAVTTKLVRVFIETPDVRATASLARVLAMLDRLNIMQEDRVNGKGMAASPPAQTNVQVNVAVSGQPPLAPIEELTDEQLQRIIDSAPRPSAAATPPTTAIDVNHGIAEPVESDRGSEGTPPPPQGTPQPP